MVPGLPAEEGSDETTHERVLEGLRSARANGLSNLLLVLVVVMLLQLFIYGYQGPERRQREGIKDQSYL